MSMPATAALLLRGTRDELGWSQRRLAERSGVAISTLSLYENGHRDPGTETLVRLLRVMGRELVSVPRAAQSRHVEMVMELVDALPQRHAEQMGFPPFRTIVRG